MENRAGFLMFYMLKSVGRGETIEYFMNMSTSIRRTAILLFILSALLFFSPQKISLAQGEDEEFRSPIRIYWSERQFLNPLATFDLSGEAVMKLCYRGLFRIDGQEKLLTDLAETAEWSSDKSALFLKLRDDLTFSNGSRLKAEDVSASILARRSYLRQKRQESSESSYQPPEPIQGNDEEAAEARASLSPRELENYLASLVPDPSGLDSLDKIQDIQMLADGRLKIQMSEPDLRLPWALTFPIIPSENVDQFDMNLIPGIGEWRLQRDSRDRGLYLKASDASIQREIHIVSCRDEHEAIQRFQNGEIDLLLLGPENFGLMDKRSQLSTHAQENNRLYFLSAGWNSQYLLSNPQNRELLRNFCSVWPARSPLSLPDELPFHKNDWRRLSMPLINRPGNPRLMSELMAVFKDQTLYIAGESGPVFRRMLDELDLRMSPLSCRLLSRASTASFEEMAAGGEYDFILGSVELSPPFQAESLAAALAAISPRMAPAFPSRLSEDLLPIDQALAWNIGREDLDISLVNRSLSEQIQAIQHSGFFFAGFQKQGLIFSEKLQGTLVSTAFSPYAGLEGLRRCD